MMMDMIEKMSRESSDKGSDPKMDLAMKKVEDLKQLASSMGMDLSELISKCDEGYESEDAEEAEEAEEAEDAPEPKSGYGKGDPKRALIIIAQQKAKQAKGE